MKLLVISSSPRKNSSQTLVLANEVLAGCAVPSRTETIHLPGCNIEFCRHCEKCHEQILQCPIKDDAAWLLKKMLAADAIIFASPNYINHITASMKALFERSSHFIHCKRLLGKYTAGVVSSGSGSNHDKEILDYMRHFSNICGAQYAGGVSSKEPVDKVKKAKAARLGRSLARAVKSKKVFADQMKVIKASTAHFKLLMKRRKHQWPSEYQYWKDKGWI